MNYTIIRYILGWLLRFEAIFLLLPAATSLVYHETTIWYWLLIAGICLILGLLLSAKKPSNAELYTRDGYMTVALSWIVMSLFGAIPFVLTGDIPNYVDALFETISGFTTTGASILSDVESLNHSALMWRSFSHWIGGMGVFVFMMAVLPLIGGSDMNLMKAESPGPSVERLVPHVKDTAKILYQIYIVITVVEAALLIIFRMPVFDAMTLTFGTVGTGGFGVRNDSIGGYTDAQQIIITIFMLLSGINYTAYFYLISGKIREIFKLEEVRWYLIIVASAVTLITVNTLQSVGSVSRSLQDAFFQVASIITTTGYSTANFDLWPELSKTVLVILMFIGACASSTGGGIKVSRFIILLKGIGKEVQTILHPRSIRKIRVDGKAVAHEVIRSTNVFIAIYFMIFMFSVLLISVDNHDFTTNFTAVLASINNIGPGLNEVGPACNFSFFSPFSKVVLMFDMLTGRLELFPMLILCAPRMHHVRKQRRREQ
ncbi:MAG: TrkH family potassium uptake protein [Lachnospiraceae bacterium]|nr:TrkH family potassium uptake protein [Lachnospiraceae bacterium]